jgi:hypothetical protein
MQVGDVDRLTEAEKKALSLYTVSQRGRGRTASLTAPRAQETRSAAENREFVVQSTEILSSAAQSAVRGSRASRRCARQRAAPQSGPHLWCGKGRLLGPLLGEDAVDATVASLSAFTAVLAESGREPPALLSQALQRQLASCAACCRAAHAFRRIAARALKSNRHATATAEAGMPRFTLLRAGHARRR